MLPKPLYDALPWLYMTLGALTTAWLDGGLRFLPATLFVLAGGLVLAYRYLLHPPASYHEVSGQAVRNISKHQIQRR